MSVKKKFEQIRAFTASGDLNSACMLAQATLKKHPKEISVALAHAEALLAGNEHAAAAHALSKFTAARNAPADLYLMRAYALMQVQQHDEGLRTIIAGLRMHRDHPELLNHAGVLCAELKRPVDAESWFRRLSEVQPQRSEAFLGLGNALREQGEFDKALQAYDAAIGLEPMNPSPQVNRANLLAEIGEHDTARGAYQDILQRFPQRKDVLSNLAASLAATNDPAGAAKLYSEYLAIHPQDFDAGLSMAKALLKSGDAAAAKNVLENMARTWPDRTEVCPELINACLRSDDEVQARHYQSAYKENFPTSADVYSCDTILDVAAGARDMSRNEANYDADMQPAQIETPAAYDSTDAFWDDVC
ncbi:MAG: Tfp pilus assembly protein PilF, partial [Gammaproteobacteria bacterium]